MSALFRATRTADFDRLYRHHAASVYRYAFAVLGNRADAEDVAQQTFLKAYRAIAQGTRPRKPENWLLKIAHNEVRRHLRASQARALEVELDERLEHPEPERTGPSLADVLRALQHLPPAQRSALVMREFEGRSYAEIAEILGITQSALESLIFRARRSLAEHFEEALTCAEAEQAVSRRLDGRLTRREARRLKRHLRECPLCASFDNVQKRQRSLFEGLSVMPVPAALFLIRGEQAAAVSLGATAAAGGGSAAVGGGVAAGFVAKVAAVAAAASVAGGVGYGVATAPHQPAKPQLAKAAPAAVAARARRVRPLASTNAPIARRTRTLPEIAHAQSKPKKAKKAKKAKKVQASRGSTTVAASLTRPHPKKTRAVKVHPPTAAAVKPTTVPVRARPQVGKKLGLSRPTRTKATRPAPVVKKPKPEAKSPPQAKPPSPPQAKPVPPSNNARGGLKEQSQE
jgi:RNA polymerase sigma factor (sigma-70 family)